MLDVRQATPDSQVVPDGGIVVRLFCCSFCGRSEREVAKLAAGPGGIHICDACVVACQLFMQGDATLPRDFRPENWPTERLLEVLGPLSATSEAHRKHLGEVVDALRARRISWAKIATPLGVSRQTAHERFG